MKGKICSIALVVLPALTALAWAADVSGKWTARAPGMQGQGEAEITLILKADGSKLTGTLNNSQSPGEVDINDGKIEGDEISFFIIRKMGENSMKVVWKGKVSGDEIKFTRAVEGGAGAMGGGAAPVEIVAKRVK